MKGLITKKHFLLVLREFGLRKMIHLLFSRNRTALAILVAIILMVTSSYAASLEEIFQWVAKETSNKAIDMPPIRIVSQSQLIEEFAKIENSFTKEQMKEVLGFYNPKTGIIFIGDFMKPLEMESTIAHEFCHHFQRVNGEMKPVLDVWGDDLNHWVLEMKAWVLTEKYLKEKRGE